MSGSEHETPKTLDWLYTRRRLLQRGGLAGLTIVGGGLLAACGSGNSKTSGTSASSGSGIQPGVGQELADLLGVTSQDVKLAQGKTWKLAGALPLTGSGAAYGTIQAQGIQLALKHIEAAGGPKIAYTQYDHKSGNAAQGASIGRQIGAAGIGSQLTSYVGILGAEVPAIGQYKVMTLDPGGSVGAFLGKPFFWGSRAFPPIDTVDGSFMYVKQKKPEWKKVFAVYQDAGSATTNAYLSAFKPALASNGLELVGTASFPVGATDYSDPIRKIQQAGQHDVILLTAFGTDSGYFMKQYRAAGGNTQVIGSDLTSDAEKIGGAAYNNFWFASDYFNYDAPTSDLSKLFIREFRSRYGELKPQHFYTANYYESTLGLWELIRRVLRNGGDLNSGEDLQKALVANPTLVSVYGGSGKTNGTMTFNVKTHGLTGRACGLFSLNSSGKVSTLATFGIGGADFRAV